MARNKAFTLLEVMISLGIIVLLTGFILVIGFGNPEKALIEDTLEDLERLVLTAKSHCHANQVDCQILLEKSHLLVTRELGSRKLIGQLEIPKQYKVQFKSKPDHDWQEVSRKPLDIFIGKSGLNTPAGILLLNNESRGELQFDPLTGKASRSLVLY